MRNVSYSFLMLMLAVCSSCSQEQEKSKAAEEKVAQEASIYELFETRNVWTFIKLDTRNGKMTQVHYALDSESYQGEVRVECEISNQREREARAFHSVSHSEHV